MVRCGSLTDEILFIFFRLRGLSKAFNKKSKIAHLLNNTFFSAVIFLNRKTPVILEICDCLFFVSIFSAMEWSLIDFRTTNASLTTCAFERKRDKKEKNKMAMIMGRYKWGKKKTFSAQGVFELTRNELLIDRCKANKPSVCFMFSDRWIKCQLIAGTVYRAAAADSRTYLSCTMTSRSRNRSWSLPLFLCALKKMLVFQDW